MDNAKKVAAVIRDYLARERISREHFAFRTKMGKSTVDKLLIGLFSDKTLSVVEQHTRLELRSLMRVGAHGTTTPEQAQRTAPPALVVLPFTNMGGDSTLDYIADGLTEDIITALARLRWLMVIARNTSFTYRGSPVDVRQVGRDLGVRYVIEGSVRVAARRVRITAQLIDSGSGKHIWAERYDRDLSDIFSVQDDITARVVAATEPHVYVEEGARLESIPPASIDAWGLVVRAMALANRLDQQQMAEARRLLETAIAVDPGYARAHAMLAWTVWWEALCYWLPREEGNGRAARHAREALLLDPSDPWGRMISGLSYSTAGQHEQALEELRIALDLNPSFALGRMARGWVLLRAGQFEAAIAETAESLRLSPLDSFSGFYSAIHGLALLGARRFADALPHLRAAVAAFAAYSGHYNTLISCCGHLGRTSEAREFIDRRNAIGPPLRLSVLRHNLRYFAHCEVFVDGLNKAGVPE